ncbi:PREDICTED: uncharacterized protein PF11_0207-like [Papilio polytes]|uniref:uncharacterized protein PF11_0207-like n=1 Tax=Papilio polytes TaxID=76194 RepID=UPI00067668A8|nr:PREDICTED: uncharacterized protein PF11_0207-like [Papilio polytes]
MENRKQQLKHQPLLQPEVGLASSVLETIQKATDEEYQEALEREASRSLVEIEPGFLDSEPENSRNSVTILLSPREDFFDTDDAMPEGSHENSKDVLIEEMQRRLDDCLKSARRAQDEANKNTDTELKDTKDSFEYDSKEADDESDMEDSIAETSDNINEQISHEEGDSITDKSIKSKLQDTDPKMYLPVNEKGSTNKELSNFDLNPEGDQNKDVTIIPQPTNEKDVTIQYLQNLSDSLLQQENKLKAKTISSEDETNFKDNENQDYEPSNDLKNEDKSASSELDPTETEENQTSEDDDPISNETNFKNYKKNNDPESTKYTYDKIDNDNDDLNSDTTLPKDSETNEMSSQASNSKYNAIVAPLSDKLKGPTLKDTFSLFKTPIQIPSLEEIRQGISEIIDAGQKESEDYQTEFDPLNESSNHDLKYRLDTKPEFKQAKPRLEANDFLQSMTRKHEDVKEKLQALHLDFNDRLASMYKRLNEQKLQSVNTPTFKAKDNKLALPKSASKKEKFNPNLNSNKLAKLDNNFLSQPQTLQDTFMKKKPTPKSNSISSKNLLRNYNIKPKTSTVPLIEREHFNKNPNLSERHKIATNKQKTFKPISKVKISFTTPKPLLASGPKITKEDPIKMPSRLSEKDRTADINNLKDISKSLRSRFQPLGDSDHAPSELIETKQLNEDSTNSQFGPMSVNNRPRLNNKQADSEIAPLKGTQEISTNSIPKKTESPLISNLREAVKAKLQNITNTHTKMSKNPVKSTNLREDDAMVSPSIVKTSVLNNPLIENTSYKCDTLGKRSSKVKDKQCAARVVDGKSVVCVCNDTYCDTITRDVPDKGSYVSYTSSKGGSRFKKKIGKLLSKRSKKSKYEYELDSGTKYQTIEGFGTAATGSAGYNLNTLPAATQDNLIRSYFSEEGLEYNMLRVPIGGSDFSLIEHAYNDLPVDDCRLTNYSLTCEDLNYKIPAIKKMMDVAKSPIHIVASTWSPPKWMKYFNERSPNCGFLKTEYFQTYADYHLKFLDEYASRRIPVWAITTTNEPSIASTNIPTTTCLGWTDNQIGKWIVENLGPTIRNSCHNDTKILALDDHRFTIDTDFYDIIKAHPKVLDYIDGLALHWYYDKDVPVQTLQKFQQNYPNLITMSTEACEGYQSYAKNKVDLGSWERAENYIKDILQNLNNNVVGWLDWNFCLDTNGGPNCMNNFVDSPIIVDSKKNEFVKQPMFYAMGHFSKFIPRGSRRIAVQANCSPKCIDEAAFLTPRNTIVFVVYNDSSTATKITVKFGDREIPLNLDAKSITTVEFNNEDCKCKSNTTAITVHASSKPVHLKVKAPRISIQI